MNKITVNRTPDVIAAEINGIKSQTRTILLCSSIEIGRRLVEAKGMVEHGQWGEWLEGQVDYSQSTANNLMRIFAEYGADQLSLFGDNAKSQTLGNLTYTQAVALLGVPAEERDQFVQDNNVAEMSTRELQQVIKERDESRKALDKQAKELATAKSDVQKLEKKLSEAKSSEMSADEADKLKKELSAAKAQVLTLTEELNKPVTVEPTIVEKIPDSVAIELEDLRKRSGKSTAVMKFGLHFEVLVSGFKDLLIDLEEIRQTDIESHGKYRGAVTGLIEKMSAKL